MFGLPFREIWALDFEFVSESGALPVPGVHGRPRIVQQPADSVVAGRAGPPAAVRRRARRAVRRVLRAGRIGLLPRAWDGRCRSEFWICTPSSGTRPTASRYRRAAACFRRCPITASPRSPAAEERSSAPWCCAAVRGRHRSAAGSWTTARPTSTVSARYWSACCRPSGPGKTVWGRRCCAAVTWRLWPAWSATGVPIDARLARANPITLGRHQARSRAGRRQGLRRLSRAPRSRPGLFAGWLAAEKIDWPRTPPGSSDSTRTLSGTWPSDTRSWSR